MSYAPAHLVSPRLLLTSTHPTPSFRAPRMACELFVLAMRAAHGGLTAAWQWWFHLTVVRAAALFVGERFLLPGGTVRILRPKPLAGDGVEGHVAHPVLLPVAREAEADCAGLWVRPLERAQVLLGLHLEGEDAALALYGEVDVPCRFRRRPIVGREAAARYQLLADVLLGELS